MGDDSNTEKKEQADSGSWAAEVGSRLDLPVIRITFTRTKDRLGKSIGAFGQVCSQGAFRAAVCEARGDVIPHLTAQAWQWLMNDIGRAVEKVEGAP